ncbi:hypothetical protein G6M50_16720 [Agrobacterium rhizogenes]|nr:hypothetical protein [Rhizobium rhizogenes]NTJ79423.1 hypothetical protein [Rhizobium rhizogenes]
MENFAVMHRRGFIRAALAGVAVAMVGDALASPTSAALITGFTTLLVFDSRFPSAKLFAARMHNFVGEIRAIQGDVTDVWNAPIHTCLAKSPMLIGGVTTPASLFCLEQMVSRYRMTLALRTDFNSPSKSDVAAVETVLTGRLRTSTLPESRRHLTDGEALVAWVLRPTAAALNSMSLT